LKKTGGLKKATFEQVYDAWKNKSKEDQDKYAWNIKKGVPYYKKKPFTYTLDGVPTGLSETQYLWDRNNCVTISIANYQLQGAGRITWSLSSRLPSGTNLPAVPATPLATAPEDIEFDFDQEDQENKQEETKGKQVQGIKKEEPLSRILTTGPLGGTSQPPPTNTRTQSAPLVT
jgi:hypothetical protein